MFSTRATGFAILGFIFVIGLSACSGSSPSPDVGDLTPSGSAAAAGPASSAPVTARDGSSLIPTSEVGACALLSVEQIEEILGDAAREIQTGEASGTAGPTEVRHENCIYPLDKAGTTTHAVVFEIVTYPDEASRANADPWESMMSPAVVTGLPGEARFAINRLSQSTEYVLAVAEGTRVRKILVSQPSEVSTWDAPEGLSVLRKLAETAKL